MKAIIVFVLIALQLAVQVGIPIHKHFCEMDGAFTSLFIKVDHECNEPHEQLPPCCQKATEPECQAALSEKDCCSDEVEVIKTQFDQVNEEPNQLKLTSSKWMLPSKIQPLFPFQKVIETTERPKFRSKWPPPPKYAGRHILILKQTWQI